MEEKELLEKKLRFLKGSLESKIISEEEYKQRKADIEKKLKELEEKKLRETKEKLEKEEAEIKKEQKEEIEVQEIKSDKLKEIEREKEEEKEIKKEEPKEEAAEIKSKKSEISGKLETSSKSPTEKKEPKEKEKDIKEKEAEEPKDKKKPDKKKKTKLIIFSIVILIILVAIYFFAFKEKGIIELKPLCISDDDCKEEGKFGTCQNPNTKEAVCIFKDAVEVNLTIINDENCESCDTSRMKQSLKQLFPGVKTTEIHFDSTEGKKLIDEFDIDILPSYIFSENLDETFNFFKVERTFTKNNNNYIMLPTATGANYLFSRDEIPNKLDLFVLPDDQDRNDKNIADVLVLFKNKIIFEKHIVEDKEKIKKELIITTYPAFLVNNQLKFTGIQSPELIKNKFCELNKLPECETKLSETIKK